MTVLTDTGGGCCCCCCYCHSPIECQLEDSRTHCARICIFRWQVLLPGACWFPPEAQARPYLCSPLAATSLICVPLRFMQAPRYSEGHFGVFVRKSFLLCLLSSPVGLLCVCEGLLSCVRPSRGFPPVCVSRGGE